MTQRVRGRRLNPAWRGAFYYFCFWAGMAVCLPFLNVHYSRLGLSGFELGLLGALGPAMRLTIGPLLATLADRRAWRRRILMVALLLAGGLLFLLRIPQTFMLLLPLAALLAVAQSAINPMADSLVSRLATRYQVDYGKLRLWGSLGFAAVALAAGAIWERVGFDAMFGVGALAMLPVVFAAYGLEEAPRAQQVTRMPLTNLFRDWGILALIFSNFVVGAGEGLYATFSGVYMDAIGGSEWMIGGLFGLSALVELPVMQYGGALARRIGKPAVLILAYVVLGLAYFGYALAKTPGVLLACAMFKGIGFGLYFPVTVSLADERVPERWSSTIQSLLMALGWGLAPLLTIPLAGWLSDTLGMARAFGLAGGLQLAAIAAIVWALGRGKFRVAPLVSTD